ncbi:MAG: hypothetical protein AVDCRST_MAG34-395, partial [uncultured Nocardioidaceae bacterium]
VPTSSRRRRRASRSGSTPETMGAEQRTGLIVAGATVAAEDDRPGRARRGTAGL